MSSENETATQTPAAEKSSVQTAAPLPTATNGAAIVAAIEQSILRSDIPDFRAGDTVKVHAKIVEGSKERIQIFEGLVIRRQKGNTPRATFTVRKLSYNIGVERTFLLHSPRIDKIELVSRGEVRRARLFYLRDLRGKSARIRSELVEASAAPAAAAAE
jgi:large subunit ribosomal protein L19